MDADPQLAALDVAELERWLDDTRAPIAELMSELPFLTTQDEAQCYLDDIREALEDLKHGRVFSHEQIVRDSEARRHRYRPNAAE